MKRKHVDLVKFKELYDAGVLVRDIGKTLGIGDRILAETTKRLRLNARKRQKNLTPNVLLLNEIGNRYNNLTVTGVVHDEKSKQWVMEVQCDCGNKSIETIRKLKRAIRKTCGVNGCPHLAHVRQENGRKAGFTGYKDIYGCRWAQWRLGAKRRKIEFNIPIEYAWGLYEKQGRKCALTGLNIEFGNSWNRKCTASLDRINSNVGYVNGNVQWVHKRINLMKGDLPEIEFLEFCKLVCKTKSRC